MFFNKRKKLMSFAMETIDFQKDNFGSRIEVIVSDIYKKIETSVAVNAEELAMWPETKQLEMLVKSRLGFGVKINTILALAAVQPFYAQSHHVFIPKMWQGKPAEDYVQEQIGDLLKKGKVKGTVNVADATVGGVFSDVVVNLYLDFTSLKRDYKLTPAETTGVILHELGHAFYAFEYSDRLDTNNQVLANTAKVCLGKKSKADSDYIFRELKTITPKIKREEIDKMMSDNRTIASYHWFKFIVDAADTGTGTQMDNGTYSKTSFEQMADTFSSRFGYGREVTIALDKLVKAGWSPEKQRSAWVFFQLLNLLWFCLGVTYLAVAIGSGWIFYAIVSALIVISMLGESGESGRNYTYDKLKLRYVRLRNDMIESLKDQKMSPKEMKPIVDNIYVMDGIIKDTMEYNTILDGFLNVFWSSDRNAGRSIREEQLLEELSANPLFIKSAELRLQS